jgi:D-threonine aldolase
MNDSWYRITNPAEIASPALLVYPDRVERNIRRAIKMVQEPQRLRPHVKTHKLDEVVRLHVSLGVVKFKCATIAEAEMTAAAGGQEVLLGYQPVGPNVQRLVNLLQRFPKTRFSTIADDADVVDALSKAMVGAAGSCLDVFLDVDCGMHRTGLPPGDAAIEVFQKIVAAKGLHAAGLHAYDGHIHDSDSEERGQRAAAAFGAVTALKGAIEAKGFVVPRIIAGGTPTFPFHAQLNQAECSPGTYVFWDFGYADSMPDLPFEIAAILLTRVVSKPGLNRLCLDLGHKAVASESAPPRVKLLDLPEAVAITHSEEHLVVETPLADNFKIGDVLYGVPRHICPTVALHSEVVVVRRGRGDERWRVRARDRALTI